MGTLLAGAIGVAATLLTQDSLRQAETATHALRLHIEADMMHDMLRADVLAHAAGVVGAADEFQEHVRDMEQSLAQLQQLVLPDPLPPRIAAERGELAAYAARGRELLALERGISLVQLEDYGARWRALEEPLDTTADALHQLVVQAERAARNARTQGILVTTLAVLLLVAAVGLAARRLSRNVLDAGSHLAEATEQAVQASRSRADFLASMSHEIRTPMTGVLGMVDLLATEELTPAQRRGYVEALRGSGQHLLAVINDILDFTRIESGKLALEKLDFSLPEVLEQLRSLVNPLAVERGLAFELELAQPAPSVLRGDPTRLRQVLLNLSSNGVKFTERGGVRVRVLPRQEEAGRWHLRFEVHDTGVGIRPEAMGELFTAFRQADQSITRRYGGSGLGLAICKRLVEAMGGRIGAQSTPGVGSLFFFELVLPEGDPRRLPVAVEGTHVAARSRRILVAEDVEINREILRRGLERAGHAPVFAADGAEAVRLAEHEAFDLVLMDVQMPVMDGIEATQRIRALPNGNSGVPIFALTANVMAQERERYLAAGMDACLMKPIDWEQLLAAVEAPGVPARAAAAAVPAPATPLIDEAAHARLVEMASREHLVEWLQAGLQGYAQGCAAMAGADAARIAAEAHKIKGSAGTLGLPALQAAAAALEASASEGEVREAQLHAVREALARTREALREQGLLEGGAAA